MDPRTLNLGAEFCRLVQAPNLHSYLEASPDALPEDLRARLTQRRKLMQGMQSNPKYKQEALFLIKNFGKLDALLSEPQDHLADMERRSESTHLPVLEMTIRSALSGGSLSAEQVAFLEKNAVELGVSPSTFSEILARLAQQHAVTLPGETETDDESDHYGVLGLSATASRAQVRAAYEARNRAIAQISDRRKALKAQARLDRAFAQLMASETLAEEDTSGRPTGPPARNRPRAEGVDPALYSAATVPPAVDRVATPRPAGGLSRSDLGVPVPVLSVSGPRSYQVTVRQRAISIPVEVSFAPSSSEQNAWVHVTAPWVEARPRQIKRAVSSQTVHIRVLPEAPSGGTAEVRFHTDAGISALVSVRVHRGRAWLLLALAAGVALVLGVISLWWLL